ncbi:hypothetical protein ACTXT7_006888 [Hymenolepis weldensis]
MLSNCVINSEIRQAQQQQKHSKTLMEVMFLKDEPRAGCSEKLNSEQLQVAIDENPICTTRELSTTFHVSRHMTTYREMKTQRQSLKVWEMAPSPSRFVRNQQATACDLLCCVSLHSRELQAPFLDPIITDSNEKWWILYNNVKRKRQ